MDGHKGAAGQINSLSQTVSGNNDMTCHAWLATRYKPSWHEHRHVRRAMLPNAYLISVTKIIRKKAMPVSEAAMHSFIALRSDELAGLNFKFVNPYIVDVSTR